MNIENQANENNRKRFDDMNMYLMYSRKDNTLHY